MGVTISSKNHSIDLGYGGFMRLRQKVAELTNILPKNSSGVYIGKPELPVSQKTCKRDLEKDKKENAVVLGQAGDGKCGTYGIEKEKE
ncbi:MAG: hypothetical protein ACLUJV_02420 [Blautia producta]